MSLMKVAPSARWLCLRGEGISSSPFGSVHLWSSMLSLQLSSFLSGLFFPCFAFPFISCFRCSGSHFASVPLWSSMFPSSIFTLS